jgi:ABC-2 type transport system permease protein
MSTLADRAEEREERAEERAKGAGPTARPVEVADGYRAGRTLPLRVELVRQLKRRRTMVMGGLLFALPFILLIAFQVGDPGGGGNGSQRINLMDTATDVRGELRRREPLRLRGLPARHPGGAVLRGHGRLGGELVVAALSARGAGARARLLWSKLAVAFGLSLAALVLLPLVALAVGTAAYGWGPLQLPVGGTLPVGTAAVRLLIVVAYILVSQLITAALAFWLSTRTDAPLGAVGGAVGLTIIGNVLDEVTALGDWRHFVPAHWQYAWLDAVQPQLDWSDMIQGTSLSVTYALVLFALAFRGFARKDVVS